MPTWTKLIPVIKTGSNVRIHLPQQNDIDAGPIKTLKLDKNLQKLESQTFSTLQMKITKLLMM